MADKKMKTSKSSKEQKNENIQVFVRVRPQNTQERQEKCGRAAVVIECNKDREIIVKERANTTLTKTFTFDRVFAPDSKQIDVYKQVVNPLIDEVLAGYNCTVFAYGQTGTGKTFTMEGERTSEDVTWEKDPLCGIIPRVLSHIFDELRLQQLEFTMAVSYLELYNEELIDLLSPIDDSTKLRLFEDAAQKGSLVIQGLQEILVLDKKEVYEIMNKGSQKRQTAATLMNAHSSRSHTIFTVTVHIRESTDDGEELLRTGKINLVDLAGSENIGRSGAKQQRAREAGNINQSLLTLGRVITALVERTPHIPYRESKLTRLLQDSLGGRTKTSIIATVSPVLANLEETLSTLDYAHRAKSITNRPEINQRLTKKALLKEYTTEIERLRRDLEATRDGTGVFMAHDNYQYMTQRLEKQDSEISESIQRIRALEEEREKKEIICERLNMELHEKSVLLTQTKENLHETQMSLVLTQEELQKTEEDRDEKGVLLESHVVTEELLSEQASTLLFVADESTSDLKRVHDKLDRKRSVEQQNFEAVQQFNDKFSQKLTRMKHDTITFAGEQTSQLNDVRTKLSDAVQSNRNIEEAAHEQASSFLESHGRSVKILETALLEQAEERQQWSQEQLKCTRDVAKSQIETLHDALTRANDKIIELSKELQNLRDNTAQNVQDTLRKVESQQQTMRQFMHQQVESIASMHQFVVSFTEQMSTEFQRSQAQVNYLTNHREASHKLQEENMQLLLQIQNNNALAQARREEEVKHFQKLSEMSENQDKIVRNHASSLGEQFDDIDKHGNTLQRTHEQIASEVTSSVKLYDNTVSEGVEAVMVGHKVLSNEVRAVEVVVEKGWQEHTESLEQQLRELAERAHNDVQNMGTHIQDIKTLALHQAEEQSTIAEARQKSLSDFVEASQSQLSEQNAVTHKWSNQHGQELTEISNGVQHFLTNGIKKDEPTGNTPQRRNMDFPRHLKATSPHERILQRFRTAKLQSKGPFKCPSMDSVLAPSSDENYSSRSTSSGSLSAPSSPDEVIENKENGTSDLIINVENTKINLQKTPNKMTQASSGNKSKRKALANQN